MDSRLSKSLSEIISDKDESLRRRRPDARSGRGASRGSTRNDRKSEPYDNSSLLRSGRREKPELVYEAALKFLLNNEMAGSIIGNGGSAMKDLIEITEASIHIGNPSRTFPGTNERVLFIYGSEASLSLAAALVWEMIGQQTHSANEGIALVWNPAAAKASPGEYDEQEVEARIAIPATCAGRILGRGGAVFRKMSNDHQVETKMSSVLDSDLLHERVVTIHGSVSGCMAFTAELLAKMLEAPEEGKYVYAGTSYPRDVAETAREALGGGGASSHRDRDAGRRSDRGDRDQRDISAGRRGNSNNNHNNNNHSYDDDSVGNGRGRGRTSTGLGASRGPPRNSTISGSSGSFGANTRVGGGFVTQTLSETSLIEIGVPNVLVGAILGIRGSKLNEITALSGAEVLISDKNEFVPGTTNRLVTIKGTPVAAQTAHTLIMAKVRQEAREKAEENR